MRLLLIILLLHSGLLCAQTGPGGVGRNDGNSTLKLWLDASYGTYKDTVGKLIAGNNERISLWKDRSGSGNDVFASFDSTRPTLSAKSPLLNFQSSVRFTRNQGNKNKRNYLSSKSFVKTNDITIYAVFHSLSRGGGNNITPYTAKTYHVNMWYQGAGILDAGSPSFVNDVSLAFCDTSLAAGVGDSTTTTDYCVKTPVSLNKTYFAQLQKEAWSGTLSIGQNGEVPSTYQAGRQPINSPSRYYVGTTSDILSPFDHPFFDGYISSIIIYNKILTLAERTILENYLSTRYAIPLKQNDLFKMDEAVMGDFDHELAGIGKAKDGSSQLTAKGEGIIEISNPRNLDKGEYLLWAHNGKAFTPQLDDVPEGVQHRMDRLWAVSITGDVGKVDLSIDKQIYSQSGNEELILLIDTDNDGLFSDEKLGEGMLLPSEQPTNGRYSFRNIQFRNGNRFTFGKLLPGCQEDCDASFSPNGDGVAETFYIETMGRTQIYNKYGQLIKTLSTPGFWDGTNANGEVAAPGIYFLISNESLQKTVTLVR